MELLLPPGLSFENLDAFIQSQQHLYQCRSVACGTLRGREKFPLTITSKFVTEDVRRLLCKIALLGVLRGVSKCFGTEEHVITTSSLNNPCLCKNKNFSFQGCVVQAHFTVFIVERDKVLEML